MCLSCSLREQGVRGLGRAQGSYGLRQGRLAKPLLHVTPILWDIVAGELWRAPGASA
jgi:hypothetical protein